jgi:antagonist of KipI
MIRVRAPGLCSTLQDLGRFGWQSLGVGTAGAMDTWAARIANELLGNDANAPLLEMTLSGAELEVCESNWCALTGADMAASCDGAPLPLCRPVWVEAGSVLRFGAARRGCRAYLAVRSGFAAARVMGSAATDLRAHIGGIGGRRLERGDELGYQQRPPAAPAVRNAPWSTRLAQPPDAEPRLRLIPGPAWSALSFADRERLAGDTFTVSRAADRMGLRLEQSLAGAATLAPILSQGVVFGAVQLPPDGRPIVLGADRQTTGGYPLLGVVASVDHAALAQLKPGDALRLHVTDVAAAQAAWRARELRLRRWRVAVRAWWHSHAP